MDQILDLQWRTPGFQTRLPESMRALGPNVVRDALGRHVPPERLAVAVVVPDAGRFLEEAATAGGFLSKDDFEVIKAEDLFR
jgi:hypothetical protein